MAKISWSKLLTQTVRGVVRAVGSASAKKPATDRPTTEPSSKRSAGRPSRQTSGGSTAVKPSDVASSANRPSGSSLGRSDRPPTRTASPGSGRSGTGPAAATDPAAVTGGRYPGDFEGQLEPVYAPDLDGDADPGEIVWTWVPYEEDYSQGKDRPVLVVGHDGPWLLGLMLTSKDHTRGSSTGRGGRRWMDIGSGPWDREGRESEVRLDRVVRLDPEAVRREGAIMPQTTFDLVVAQVH